MKKLLTGVIVLCVGIAVGFAGSTFAAATKTRPNTSKVEDQALPDAIQSLEDEHEEALSAASKGELKLLAKKKKIKKIQKTSKTPSHPGLELHP